MKKMTYKEAALDYALNPRDVHTVLKDGRIGHWFYAYTEDGIIYAAPAKNHNPSCHMRKPIKINENQFENMLDLFHRRLAGEHVSREAMEITRTQVYWYGIFNDLQID